MARIELAGVGKRFGAVETIRDVNLDLHDREFVEFVGPSGCGKSTLLRLVAGLEDVSAGEIRFDGQVVNELTPPERGIAMVFQSYALYPHMSVFENMMFGLKLAKTDRALAERRVREAARILQLDRLLDRKPRELSGGQRQRVAIGRAITRDPKVFLFDEPLSNLDAALRVQMRIEIAKLHRRLDATMIYVTHDQVEAMTLADRIVVLDAGEVRQVGTPIELYQHPANRFVAGFIGSPKMNFLPATYPKGFAIPHEAVEVGVRPEHLRLGEPGDASVEGRVLAVERLGAESWVYVDLGLDDPLVVKHAGMADLPPEGAVTVGLPAEACYLFDRQGRSLPRAAFG
jgi:multiple sugar transport system ATP-binding protein